MNLNPLPRGAADAAPDDLGSFGETRISGRNARSDYLRSLVSEERPPLLVVSGLPGAGKTTLLQFLSHDRSNIFTPTTRYMPRDRRPSDTVGDAPWSLHDQSASGSDPAGPEAIIFSNVKYQGYYGFPGSDIAAAWNRGEVPVMLVTSYVEMVQLTEALHNLLPMAPIVTLRMEVPQEVLPRRIAGRAGAHPDEHRERISKLQDLARADMLQTPLLHKVYGSKVIWNLKPVEIEEFGYSPNQIQALCPDAVVAIMNDAAVRAKDRSAREARDVLWVRRLVYGDPVVPGAIIDVLDRILLPAAQEIVPRAESGRLDESALIVKAGLAAALYLGEKGRPVSPDIDYTLVESPQSKLLMEMLMERAAGAVPAWTDGKEKAVYHCDGLKGSGRADDGSLVELDAILTTRVQPDAAGFCFVITHDEQDLFHRRTVETPLGYRFGLVPPEQLCIEKLLAGRGPEIGKFDLFDASGLLSQYEMNPSIIKKMVEMQKFDPVLDADARRVIEADGGSLSDETLQRLGVTEPAIVSIVRTLGPLIADAAAPKPSEERTLSFSALKQFAFLSSVERSLKRIESMLSVEAFPIGAEHAAIGPRFGADDVLKGISRVRAQLLLHAGYYVGTNDTFVRRTLGSELETARFFSRLDDQRHRLTSRAPRLDDESAPMRGELPPPAGWPGAAL